MSKHNIAVVAFDGISPFHLSLPGLVFGMDRSDQGMPTYDFSVCSAERGELRTTGGFTVAAPYGLGRLTTAQTVIVPSWRDPREPAPKGLVAALRKAHGRGAQLVGLCLGAFVIAETGVLDARHATTHWFWSDLFSRRFPQVHLEPEKLYVDEGDVLTSAGNAAGLDCCLHLLRTQCGADVANRVARRLVVAPHRQGGQAQFIERPIQVDRGGDRLTQVIDWVRLHPELPHTIDSLAARAILSRRTFTRRFGQLTGTSVKRWLIDQRLALAQRLLETTSTGIEDIAASIGFSDAVSLRQHFTERLHTTPSLYRKHFQTRAELVGA